MGSGEAQQVSSSDIDEIRRVGALYGRAFSDDPLFVYAFPEPSTRAAKIGMFLGTIAHSCTYAGQLWTVSESAASWRPPAYAGAGDEVRQIVGADTLPDRLGVDQFERLMTTLGNLHEHEASLGLPDSWNLSVLGTEPGHAGRGHARRVLSPVLDACTSAGLPCSLETMNPMNVPLYEHFGFEVAAKGTESASQLPYWIMLRPAHTHDRPLTL